MATGVRNDDDTGRTVFNDPVFLVPFNDGTNGEIRR
jgi:hypothetical protein